MGDFTPARGLALSPKNISIQFLEPTNGSVSSSLLGLKITDGLFRDSKPTEERSMANEVLFAYEPKRNSLTYDFSDKVFETAKHELELEVEDKCGKQINL